MDQRIVTALLDCSTYPEPTTSVTSIQTHISYLFLTDKYVYKVKKPVDFGFLNFTTLDRRRFYCNEEVRLNSRLSPDIYLGVVELRETAEGIGFNGDGRIIEYAVKMRRLPSEQMLDRLIDKNRVTTADIRHIAVTIADFHRRAEQNAEIDKYGSIEEILRNWDENFAQLAPFVDQTVAAVDLQLIKDWVSTFISMRHDLFTKRVAGGFIRDGDGDLHLENICIGERVWIFDCIEFNHRFRYGDTASDLAFLLMDLDLHGRQTFAWQLLDEYRKITGDQEIVDLLVFYKIYRAVVRGKVSSLQLLDQDITIAAKTAATLKASRYFRLARGYILMQRLPLTLFITCGVMGSGKSSVARELAFELGIKAVCSDLVRKELAGLAGTSRHYDAFAAGLYAPQSTQETYAELRRRTAQELNACHTVIVDASFGSKDERSAFSSLAAEFGASFVVLNTEATEELCRKRLVNRANEPDEVSDGRWEIFHQHRNSFEAVSKDEGLIILLDTSLPLGDNIYNIYNLLGLYNVE